MPSLQGIEAAIRGLVAEENDEQQRAQEDRERRDLAAQEGMALWAEWMTYATGATVVLTFVGLIALLRTLHHTRRAADYTSAMLEEAKKTTIAAQDAVHEAKKATVAAEAGVAVAREIGRAQARAYLSATGANYNLTQDELVISLNITNSGSSPALNVSVGAQLKANRNGIPEQPDSLKIEVLAQLAQTYVGTIAATAQANALLGWYAELEDPGLFEGLTQGNDPWVMCDLHWDDVFGVHHVVKVSVNSLERTLEQASYGLSIRSGKLVAYQRGHESHTPDGNTT